ncbi:MAG: sulfotransferase domain-containing protein [Planctomycetota bacterium]
MKSGTNWVGSLLSSHVSIHCVGEFHWQEIVQPFNKNLGSLPAFLNQHKHLVESTRDHLEEMIQQTLIDAAEPTATLIGDRTPHSIVPVIMRNVPHISVIRDGRDVLVSRAFHLFNRPEVAPIFDRLPSMRAALEAFQNDSWFFHKHPDQLLANEEFVRVSAAWWRDHLASDFQAVERYPQLPVLFVRYEDIHADTAGQRQKMFEFLNVDPTKAAKIEGVLQPGFKQERPSEFLRKGAVGDWKNYFTDQSKSWFKEIAGQTLIQQGYASDDSW